MTVPTGSFAPFHNEWYLADSEYGWYVVSPWGGQCGPFTEERAGERMRELRAYPVWCPLCLVPMQQTMVQEPDYWCHNLWRCPSCTLEISQDEIARIIGVNE